MPFPFDTLYVVDFFAGLAAVPAVRLPQDEGQTLGGGPLVFCYRVLDTVS